MGVNYFMFSNYASRQYHDGNKSKTYKRRSSFPEQISTERLITETARGFVYDWATYNGDEQDYKNRLRQYGKADSYKLGSIQKM